MTPNDLAVATAIAAVVKEMGAWPPILVLAVLQIAPWLFMVWVTRSIEKRHAAAVQMYENNVLLVENYEKISGSLLEVVSLNTQTQTRLQSAIRNNEFCPAVREKGPNRP